MNLIKRMWNDKPLAFILFLAFFVRMFSVIFSKGFGMHDDHFLIIEAAKSWADGYDYNHWLPDPKSEVPTPSGHSFFYTGLHYFLFCFLKLIHLTDPQGEMYVVRFLHAILSLVTVYCGFKITAKLAGEKQAKTVGLLLAIFWFMPFLSVRNLIEYVCIAPLIYATWLVIKNGDEKKLAPFIWAGFWLGIAFNIRFQTIIFAGGFGLALLFSKRIKEAFIVGFMFLLIGGGIQGTTDYFVWGVPFTEFGEYVRYNIASANDYLVGQWYMYITLLLGILIPPISFFFFFGYFRNWKKNLILFLPSFIFLAFHCYFPNKQERFILPVVPFIIILGYIGWDEFVTKSKFWAQRQKLLRNCWIFFWVLNTIPLSVITFAYSKKNRVEAMTYIASKGDVTALVIEDGTSDSDDYTMPPQFYLEKWLMVYGVTQTHPTSELAKFYPYLQPKDKPNYVVFMKEEDLDKRVEEFKKYFPTLTYQATIEPSSIDKLMHWLNPVNKNQTSYVYKIN